MALVRMTGHGVFACESCGLRYRVQVEPEKEDADLTAVDHAWMMAVYHCPKCGSTVEVINRRSDGPEEASE